MPIRLFNTYSRQTEEFEPLDANKVVKMYTCGPTVYNHAHIGNFRAYIFEDLLQRHLEYRGFKVERVMNLTDVDDKTIRGCLEAKMKLAEFTQQYKDAFFEDLEALRIKRADHFPSATDPQHITKMIDMIDLLIKREFAYQAEDGSVYFRLSKFPNYGRLAHLNLDELRPTGRVRNDEYEKENIGDFALWKAWDIGDGEVAWESPWGRGRPGWHIECSAMATGILGSQLDIHCGAVDNIFPHHEAEIAQSEACTNKQFVRYWVHCAHLIVDGQKMSKSQGNFYTLRDLVAKGFTGREVRYLLMGVNYRLPLNFTLKGLVGARSALARIDEWVNRLTEHAADEKSSTSQLLSRQTAFEEALDDDLNISAALGYLFDMIRESNLAMDQNRLTSGEAQALLIWWNRINSILSLECGQESIPEIILNLLHQRKEAREAKNWILSDQVRMQIETMGWLVKDTKDGQKIIKHRASNVDANEICNFSTLN